MMGAPNPTEGAVAAIDCGTNSTRLLIADRMGRTIQREMRITRLGEGVDATGELSSSAMDRTLGVVAEYRQALVTHSVRRCRLVATSAVRDASNGPRFLEDLSETAGCRAELLNGEEEALLSFRGATRELDPCPDGDFVVDIGGGSTELIFGRQRRLSMFSAQIGCVRVTERCFAHDPPRPKEVDEAVDVIHGELKRAISECPSLGEVRAGTRLIGLAGTISTLSALNQGLTTYNARLLHHSLLKKDDVEHWCDRLVKLRASERIQLPGMFPGREDVILAGVLVLREIMREFGFGTCLTSEADILDGLTQSLLE